MKNIESYKFFPMYLDMDNKVFCTRSDCNEDLLSDGEYNMSSDSLIGLECQIDDLLTPKNEKIYEVLLSKTEPLVGHTLLHEAEAYFICSAERDGRNGVRIVNKRNLYFREAFCKKDAYSAFLETIEDFKKTKADLAALTNRESQLRDLITRFIKE